MIMEVGSDFSGVGAFNQALTRLNINYKTVFACDMDKYARQTYIANYGEPEYYPENVYDREIPKKPLGIYMTSPPCQSFSLVGKRKGKDSDNGILFFNSHEFIQNNKPRYFIFENVKGLLSDDNGKTFSEWVNMLGGKSVNGNPVLFPYESSVPYHIYHRVLNAKKYGVPQNRERVFIIGIRDDSDNNFRWPKEVPLVKKLKDVLETFETSDFKTQEEFDKYLEKYYLSDKMIKGFVSKGGDFGDRFKPTTGEKYSMAITTSSGSRITDNFINDSGYINQDTQASQVHLEINSEDTSNALTTVQKDNLVITDRIRRLTPLECFRLMDFPDTFVKTTKEAGLSDTQMYRQAGNSIVVAVLSGIISKLKLDV